MSASISCPLCNTASQFSSYTVLRGFTAAICPIQSYSSTKVAATDYPPDQARANFTAGATVSGAIFPPTVLTALLAQGLLV